MRSRGSVVFSLNLSQKYHTIWYLRKLCQDQNILDWGNTKISLKTALNAFETAK